MGKYRDELIEYGNDTSKWADISSSKLPKAIKNKYSKIYELTKEGNIYGVTSNLRDVYETLLKIYSVMALITIEDRNSDEDIKELN